MKGERNVFRSVRGPVTLITIGVLFALQNFTPYDFGQTWPVLLIVFGLLSLLGRTTAPPPPAPPPQYAWQPPAWQPQPPVDQPAGGYRATSYAQGPNPQPAAGAAKPDTPPESSTPGGAV
jgi:hypothetical protein